MQPLRRSSSLLPLGTWVSRKYILRRGPQLSRALACASMPLGAAMGVLPHMELFWSSSPSLGFAARPLSTSEQRAKENSTKSEDAENQTHKSLMYDKEEYSIGSEMAQKPMTAAEGVSYTAVILAAFAVLGAIIWAFISTYIMDPLEYICFNLTLDKLRQDPRIIVRLGNTIKGYGEDSSHRWQRQRIPNREYTDPKGTQHLQIQFHIKGHGGVGVVYADMYKDNSKKWQYSYLYVDFPSGGSSQRLAIVRPQI
ncbi:unnamed protein product [Ostreobium quekettii]|uniref:Mitochondrial import inner membrane translocase subunit Tim21 n=1 Tax=Ostreobium quekettii TaxID=121088 RepID=A0A8S1IPX8_9CHLO|nr:unnamed protein product [Ostreobium quekettii]|eukprot:evm.model.scf_1307EXC.2 EVM.evm.TU.scf_1307EXC.2   scf_1307EXC:5555-9201(+)